MAMRRMQETNERGLRDYVERSSKLQIAAKQEVSVGQRRKQLQQLEAEKEERLRVLEENRLRDLKRRELETDCAEMFASALEKRKAEQRRKETETARICGESEELKALENKLKIAYVNKERAAQHEEKLEKEIRERARERAMEAKMETDRLFKESEENIKGSTSQEAQRLQQAALKEQILERERRALLAEEEAKRDKDLVEEVVMKIRNEDRKDYEEKQRRKVASKKLLEQYEAQRLLEVAQKKKKEEEDEKDILKYAESVSKRDAELKRKQDLKKERDAENFRRIVKETERQREADEEMQQLRDILWEEEMEAARRREDDARKERQLKLKGDMKVANELQLRAKQEQALKDQQAEDQLVEMMNKKFASDEKQDEESRDAKRQQKLAYIDAVEQQKIERARLYDLAKKAELDETSGDQAADDYKAKVIKEARRRLLEQHAKNLDGFLPKGTLNHDELHYYNEATDDYEP